MKNFKIFALATALAPILVFGGGKDIEGNDLSRDSKIGYVDGDLTTVGNIADFAKSGTSTNTVIDIVDSLFEGGTDKVNRVTASFDNVSNKVDDVGSALDNVSNDVVTISSALDNVSNDVVTLGSALGNVSNDVVTLGSAFVNVSNDVVTLGSALWNVSNDVVTIQCKESTWDAKQDKIDDYTSTNAVKDIVKDMDPIDIGALPDNYDRLTNNANFKSAVEKVSPPVELPQYWALANVTNSTGDKADVCVVARDENYKAVSNNAMTAVQSLAPAINYTTAVSNKLEGAIAGKRGLTDFDATIVSFPSGAVNPSDFPKIVFMPVGSPEYTMTWDSGRNKWASEGDMFIITVSGSIFTFEASFGSGIWTGYPPNGTVHLELSGGMEIDISAIMTVNAKLTRTSATSGLAKLGADGVLTAATAEEIRTDGVVYSKDEIDSLTKDFVTKSVTNDVATEVRGKVSQGDVDATIVASNLCTAASISNDFPIVTNAYTKADADSTFLGINSTAADSSLLGGKTKEQVISGLIDAEAATNAANAVVGEVYGDMTNATYTATNSVAYIENIVTNTGAYFEIGQEGLDLIKSNELVFSSEYELTNLAASAAIDLYSGRTAFVDVNDGGTTNLTIDLKFATGVKKGGDALLRVGATIAGLIGTLTINGSANFVPKGIKADDWKFDAGDHLYSFTKTSVTNGVIEVWVGHAKSEYGN